MGLIEPSDPAKGEKQQSDHGLGTTVEEADTWIYPLVQMGPFGIEQDYVVTETLFQNAPEKSHIKLASGYFNLTEKYIETILNQSLASFNILTASPEVSRFCNKIFLFQVSPPEYFLYSGDYCKCSLISNY